MEAEAALTSDKVGSKPVTHTLAIAVVLHLKHGNITHRSCSMATRESAVEPLEQVLNNFKILRILFPASIHSQKKTLTHLYKCLPVPLSLLLNQGTHPICS